VRDVISNDAQTETEGKGSATEINLVTEMVFCGFILVAASPASDWPIAKFAQYSGCAHGVIIVLRMGSTDRKIRSVTCGRSLHCPVV
jgi:hypothetical protein